MYFYGNTSPISRGNGLGGIQCMSDFSCKSDVSNSSRQQVTDLFTAVNLFSSGFTNGGAFSPFSTDGGGDIGAAVDRIIYITKQSPNPPTWSKDLTARKLATNIATAISFLKNFAGVTGHTSTPAGATPAAQPTVVVATPTYKCTAKVCYSVNSKPQNEIFANFQKALNAVGGSAGFNKITPDGLIGTSTLAAWMKAKAWMGANAPNYTTVTQIAANAGGLTKILNLAAFAAKPAVAPPPPSSPSYTPPVIDPIPAPDVPAVKASQKIMWPYYAAAGIGGFAVLMIAFKLSAPRAQPALPMAGTYAENKERVREAIAKFPKKFRLRGHDGEFRVSEHSSYVGGRDDDTVMLYTERRNDKGVWQDFAKGTVAELQREVIEI